MHSSRIDVSFWKKWATCRQTQNMLYDIHIPNSMIHLCKQSTYLEQHSNITAIGFKLHDIPTLTTQAPVHVCTFAFAIQCMTGASSFTDTMTAGSPSLAPVLLKSSAEFLLRRTSPTPCIWSAYRAWWAEKMSIVKRIFGVGLPFFLTTDTFLE